MTPDEGSDGTLEFIKSRFEEYYAKADLYLPERFGKREFGFMFFGQGSMQRHTSFRTKDELRQFLIKKVPMHVYHSSAYYERPDAPTMDEKCWMGADLIFDLDADHLKGAKDMGYPEMLAEVKRQFTNLLENYILDDLGFSKPHLTVVFSGARGYHLHVRDPRVMDLNSHERRAIVDYITGPSAEEIDRFVFEKVPFDKREFKAGGRKRVDVKFIRRLPGRDDCGWKKKMRLGVENLLSELQTMGRDKALEFLQGFGGIGSGRAAGIWNDLFEGTPKGAARMLSEDNFEVFSSDKNREGFIRVVIESQKVKLEGEADEPVTSDTKRLIRLPSSLHGKTALRTMRIPIEKLGDFEPLRDAFPDSFGSEQVNVELGKSMAMELKGEKFNLSKGMCRIPEYAALFFLCRNLARLPRRA